MAITLETIVKLPTSRKILILAGLVAVIIGLYAYLRYWPNLDLLKKKKTEIGSLENQVRELRIVAANMKRFQAEAAKLREELQVAINQLPTSKEIPTLLSNISQLGKDSGLEFLLFRRFNAGLAPLKEFVLPGGSHAAAFAHVGRTVCRRAERALVRLAAEAPVSDPARRYLNRSRTCCSCRRAG